MGRRGFAAYGSCWLALSSFLASFLIALTANSTEEVPASTLFGLKRKAADLPQQSIGTYSSGCLAGGVSISESGLGFQTMRPSRNRNWAHPMLKGFIEELGAEVAKRKYAGLLVGDFSQPRGGPIAGGHLSHQTGLDVDIWFKPSPNHKLTISDREGISADSVVVGTNWPWVNAKFTDREIWLLKVVAEEPRVARVFVAAPIKKALCENKKINEFSWLQKIRPWYGHTHHFHVRLTCPSDSAECIEQAMLPDGPGCGAELDWWLSSERTITKREKSQTKSKVKLLTDLPENCSNVLNAEALR
jgi:penicillin-insensitive murein endopeptidase